MTIRALFLSFSLMIIGSSFAQENHSSFKPGEWFRFRIHYGVFTASYATLEVKEEKLNNTPVYHIIGEGKSSGLLSLFFKVEDNYETYIDKKEVRPYRFVRKINEGGHTKDIEINFDHQKNEALVFNKKYNTKKTFTIKENVQDMMSSFYFLRNEIDTSNLKKGDEFFVNMFFDSENYKFKLKFLGREVLKTKIGKMNTLKFRPYVQADRIFKEEESMTVWVSDDDNRMPLKIKADIVVGSIQADLIAFKGLKHPFKIIVD
ncbi:DUF3108 domain-containing protein [Aquimarina sp. 2201CG5-10]|uniref:DUF3108 domain-containing protein n=1 Tax=Aquimarina callyspongiae TaxID=3098150 RepID=UPI002AB53816|nr:DUF3108 domain-containing protein [Aquimarina sp. 2201CG5-10]MDY8135218.1 DUF3108 domain-containing protein [Aquimarina sp. 2201CG5-10]